MIAELQFVMGMKPYIGPMTADVDEDDKFGVTDVIYVMEMVAGLRE